MEFNNPLRRMLPGTPLDRNVRIDQWYDLHAFVVARVVPTVADIERGVVSEAPGPACELLELLSEGVVPRACPRPRGLDEVARLLPRGVRVQEQVGEEAARPAVEALRAVHPHRLAALQALVDLARVTPQKG